MKRELKQSEKDAIVGRPCIASFHGKLVAGYINGRKLVAPVFMEKEKTGIAFEVSWALAERAVLQGKLIVY